MLDGITKVLVTGSRDWDNWDLIRETLEPYVGEGVYLMHGDARGADKMCGYVWESWGLNVIKRPADWEKFGKAAGILRNEGMVLSGPDILIAFQKDGSRGTQHCIDFAKSRKVKTVVVEYVAPVTKEKSVSDDGSPVEKALAEPVF